MRSYVNRWIPVVHRQEMLNPLTCLHKTRIIGKALGASNVELMEHCPDPFDCVGKRRNST